MALEISTSNTCKRYECWISCDLLFLITWNVVHLPLSFAILGEGGGGAAFYHRYDGHMHPSSQCWGLFN